MTLPKMFGGHPRRTATCWISLIVVVFGIRYLNAQQRPHDSAIEQLSVDGAKLGVSSVTWLGIRSDGSIAISPSRGETGLFLSPNGARIATASAPGGGELTLQGMLGDTVWGRSRIEGTLVFIGSDNRVVRSLQVPTAATMPSGDVIEPGYLVIGGVRSGGFAVGAVRPDGDLLLSLMATPASIEGWPGRGWAPLLRISPLGGVRGVVGWIAPSRNPDCSAATDECPPMLHVYGSSGERIAMVWAAVTRPDSTLAAVTMISTAGDTVYRTRFKLLGVPPDSTDSYNRIKWAVLAANGDLWLQPPSSKASNTEWNVIDGAGHLARVVAIPRDVMVMAVAGDVIWGARKPSGGTLSIVKLRIVHTQ
jgi:hypothetical protein